MANKTLYCDVKKYRYKDMTICCGLVKNSPHKVNELYFQFGESVFHLRIDEAYALLSGLTETLWILSMAKINKYKGFKFKSKYTGRNNG